MPSTAEILLAIADDPELLEIARHEIEARLIDYRDSRLSQLGRGNGLVIREATGEESSVIRFGPETAMCIGLKAIAEHFKSEQSPNSDHPEADDSLRSVGDE